MSQRKKQKLECKKKTSQFEKTLEEKKWKIAQPKKKEKENEERERYNSSKEKRKQILGDTMNSGPHKKDECASENTMDVPKTRKALIKTESLARLCERKNRFKANATKKIFLKKN